MCKCCDTDQRRQDVRGPNQAFWWGFFFSVWGLVIVAVTKDDYPEGYSPLANAVMGLAVSWVVVMIVLAVVSSMLFWR